MNFVFARRAAFGIGTGGHCVDALKQHVILLPLAPGTSNPVLVDIGTAIARHENGIGDDFALVSINPALYPWVSGTTAVIGGPFGQNTRSRPQNVAPYRARIAFGSRGTPRLGGALSLNTL